MSLLENYQRYSGLVPHLPSNLIDSCSKKTSQRREMLLFYMRSSILLPLIRSKVFPEHPFPERSTLFDVLREQPGEIILSVQPQQIQFISLFISYIHQNPQIFAEIVNKHFTRASQPNTIYMCYSAIPAIFGFYSTQEHISLACQFFYALINCASPRVVFQVLAPFFRSACTFRVIESIYEKFGKKFVHDERYESKKPQSSVVERYGAIFTQAVRETYCLLPHEHQFLLRYMILHGFEQKTCLGFYLNIFVFPQMTAYFRNSPFKNHLIQFSYFSENFHTEDLFDIFDAQSISEIPSGFVVFRDPFIQILVTSADIDFIVKVFKSADKLPPNVIPFLNSNLYFHSIDYQPFWMRIFQRRPQPPTNSSGNWRNVVFSDFITHEKVEIIQEYERIFNQIIATDSQNPYAVVQSELIRQILKDKYQVFADYFLHRLVDELINRAQVFEIYLVNSLALKTLTDWYTIVFTYYEAVFTPVIEENMKSNMRNGSKIDWENLENHVLDGTIAIHLQFSMILQRFTPKLVTHEMSASLKKLKIEWKNLMDQARGEIRLPKAFRNISINRIFWDAIGHMRMVEHVEFQWVMTIILESLRQIQTINNALGEDKDQDEILFKYAIAFCDCSVLVTHFMIINTIVSKQSFITFDENDLTLWCKMEMSILKLASLDEEVMNLYLDIQSTLSRTFQ